MTNIYIDFSKTNPVFGNTLAGHIGEHNATSLIITPPKSMSEDNRIINYAVSFETEGGERYKSDIYTKSATVETPLYSQLTSDDILYIQLEGYGQDKNVIMKSDVVFLRFGGSLGDGGTAVDSSVKPQENIIQFGWVPENKDVLEAFGEYRPSTGISYITFNGRRLSSLSEFKTKALFTSSDFEFKDPTINDLPNDSSTYFYIYCYDIPTGYSVEDVYFFYTDSDGNKKQFSLNKWHSSNYIILQKINSISTNGRVCTVHRKKTNVPFTSNADVNNFIEHINNFGQVSVVIEYGVKNIY